MNKLHKILWVLVYALPAVLFFSYYPIISLGGNSSMNFELSLPLIWLVIFDILSFIWLIGWGVRQRKISHNSQGKVQSIKASHHTSKPQAGKKSPISLSRLLSGSPQFFGISDRRFFLFALLPLYLTISILWSANPLRGILTAGVMWLVFFAVFAILYILPLGGTPRKLRTHVLLVFFVAAVLVCKFCYAQSIMDILGVDREHTLLCLGCTYRSFGFPHPSGFAIEPQFMGNLLLAPTLTALYLVVFRQRKAYRNLTKEVDNVENLAEQRILHEKIKLPHINWAKWQNIGLIILAGFFSMTLFFTFSRGAIYAYVVALLVLLIIALKRHQFRWTLITIPAVSFLLSLGLQGTFAAVGPTAETFVSAVTKSIHQLSLGIVDLRGLAPAPTPQPVDNSVTKVENLTTNCGKDVDNPASAVDKPAVAVDNSSETVDNSPDSETCIKPIKGSINLDILILPADAELPAENDTEGNQPTFDGYVEESTNIRLSLNHTAVQTWADNPARMLFGVGLGGAGTAMHELYPEAVTSPKEIVQNEPFSLLLETGLIGIALVVFTLLIAFWPGLFSAKFLDGENANSNKPVNAFWQHPVLPLLLSLVVAYLITLNFFSGLPNALQIYLMPPLLYLIFRNPSASVRSVVHK